jgi:hypothetical protein
MSGQINKTFGFQGEPETRLEREFENLYKSKASAQAVKMFEVPNASTVPEAEFRVAKVSGNWYIYIRIEGAWYRAALTAA